MPHPTEDNLISVGFVDFAAWKASGEKIRLAFDGESAALFDNSNSLYAFVVAGQVVYNGKTSRSLRKRLVGYAAPGSS